MATVETFSTGGLQPLQRQIVARMSRVRRRVRTGLIVEGIAIVLAEATGMALLAFLADHTFRLGVAVRIGMLITTSVVLVCEAWRRVVGPMRLRLDLVALAGAIGRRSPGIEHDLAARVATVLELPRLLEGRGAPSAAMVERAVRRRFESLAATDFDATLDRGRLRMMCAVIAAAVLIPAALAAFNPETAGLWARRFFLASREPWPQKTYLEIAGVRDWRIAVPRGEPYSIRARASDRSAVPERILLTIRGGDKTSVLMKEFGPNDFRHDFAVVEGPLELEFEGGDDDCGPILLDPVDRPRITRLELTAQHPRQSAAEKHNFDGGDADLNFLVETKLSLAMTANVPLSRMRLKPQSARPLATELREIDATHYVVEWIQKGPAKFDLELVAADSGLVSLPVPVSIGLKVDRPPRVTLAYSGVHPRITPQARIPLDIDARDDYGLAAVGLTIKDETPDPADPAKLVPHSAAVPLFPLADAGSGRPAPTKPSELPPELQLKHTVDVGPMKLPIGALVSITAQATDDCYTGRQTSRSRPTTFRLVAPEELFREILQRQQAERIRFRKQMEEAEKIREALAAASDVRPLADLTRRHRALHRETHRIAVAFTESLTEIKLNALGSPESHALMERNVLAPLAALEKELIEPQVAALDTLLPAGGESLDPAKVQAVLDRQDQIVARMKIILQRMAQWDSFVDVLNQLEQIIKLETQVEKGSERLQKKETEGLFDK